MHQHVNKNGIQYGVLQAAKILAAHRLGLEVKHIDNAERMLKGASMFSTVGAAIDKEATDIHNKLASLPEKLPAANKAMQDVLAEFGYSINH